MTNEHIQLLEKYLADSLTEEEKETLLHLLQTSPNFKEELTEAVNTKALIYAAKNEEPVVVEVFDKISALDQDLENGIMSRISKKKQNSVVYAFLKAAAVAALFFIAFKFSVEKIQTVASFNKSSETTIKREDPGNKDYSKLYVNDTILTGGDKEDIDFEDGTKLNLKRKSELKIVSKNPKVFALNKGSITAEVTPQNEPMKIETNSATVKVLGTKFSLSSQKNSSLLKVKRGKVAITDKKTGERVIVSTGTYTIAEGKKMELKAGDGPLFVSDAISQSSGKKYVDIELEVSGKSRIYLVSENLKNSPDCNASWISPLLHVSGRWISMTKLEPKIKVATGEIQTFTGSENQDQLVVNGTSFGRGIISPANSILMWDLPAGATIFKCRAALTDNSAQNSQVKFLVFSQMSEKLIKEYSN